MSMSEEEAIKYIRMLLKDSKMSDAEKALGYVYATEAIETLIAASEKKDKIINMLFSEREYIKNNLEVDLNKKGVYSQAKGQISQILKYYENNDKYFEKKAEEE